MTTHDQNKKTLRHFQCRDYLWEVFEQMSTELECSTDYLINEAMRQYARSRNYGTSRSAQPPRQEQHEPHESDLHEELIATNPPPQLLDTADEAHAGLGAANGIPSLRDSARAAAQPQQPSPPRQRTVTPAVVSPHASHGSSPDLVAQSGIASLPAIPRRPTAGGSLPPLPPPPPRPRVPTHVPSAAHASNPPPLPTQHQQAQRAVPQQAPAPAPSARPRPLFIIFNGQKIPVSKEEFVIGRGSKSADLAIKDGNISRRHAAVVLHSGAYYLKDLGSTNGVEFQGRRFDSKRIEEGDLFRICDYELRFTYQ